MIALYKLIIYKNERTSFEKTGSVSPTLPKRKRSSKKREDTKNELETMVTEFPNISLRRAASALGGFTNACNFYFNLMPYI